MATVDYIAVPTDTDPYELPQAATPDVLRAALDEVRDELRRADTKAIGLLGLFGAALAGVITLIQRNPSIAATILLLLAALPLGGAVVLLARAVRPQIGRSGGVGRWELFRHDPAALLDDLAATASPKRIAARITDLSALAVAKFRRTTRAVDLLLPGVALVILAALVA